jgi:glycosyltransferase involved in cell wall biosynthesis
MTGARLRVLHVYKDVFPPVAGGVEKQIDALRRAMPDVDSTVIVCARAARSDVASVDGGLEIRVAELGPRWLGAPAAPTLPLWVRRTDSDLIHLHMPNPPGEVAALFGRRGRPIVASYHADIVRQARFEPVYRPFVGACFSRASAIVTGTQRLAETSPALRGQRSKVRVIPYVVDVERYRPDAVDPARRAAIRERFGEPLVISVGRLVYYKGYDLLIEAARGLDAQVVIVGEGPERAALEARAAGVPNVHLTGRLDEDDLVAHLAAADLFVLPSTSRAESFGIAVAEAQAMGLPAVVTDTGSGTVEAVDDGATGLVVPAGDAAALREALAGLIADEPRRRSMGDAARPRAVERHRLEDRARDFRELYEEVLRGRRSG